MEPNYIPAHLEAMPLHSAGDQLCPAWVLLGQIIVCLFVGLLFTEVLPLGIPYALFIGFLAGLFDIIPYFGPVLGFLPAAALALAKSPLTVLWVLLVFVTANQLENAVISPKLIGDRVGLHTLVVIFAVFAGGDLMGIFGMLLAIPVAAIIRVILAFFSRRPPPGTSSVPSWSVDKGGGFVTIELMRKIFLVQK